ncbi:MAG: hypothetical protein M1827_004582 [Pycnora praestabilis]|nr:MAG: hypothetical protein M1827_004582 [Pycnora praestabilis]
MKSITGLVTALVMFIMLSGVLAIPMAPVDDALIERGDLGEMDIFVGDLLLERDDYPTAVAIPPPQPTPSGTTGTCAKWYSPTNTDYQACDKALENGNMTLGEFRLLNGIVNNNCSNLWVGYSYCVQEGVAVGQSYNPSAAPSAITSPFISGTWQPATRVILVTTTSSTFFTTKRSADNDDTPSKDRPKRAADVEDPSSKDWPKRSAEGDDTFNKDWPKRSADIDTMPPIPDFPKRASPPSATLLEIVTLASDLFAAELVGALSTQNETEWLCKSFPVFETAIVAELLNTTAIQNYVCASANKPLPTGAASNKAIIELSTLIFIAQIQGLVIGAANLKTFCGIFDFSLAAELGFDAGLLQAAICPS